VHPIGHDGIKRGSGRVEPKCKSEAGDEETGDRDKKTDIFFLESLLKSMGKIKLNWPIFYKIDLRAPEAAVENVAQADECAPGKDACGEAESVEGVAYRSILSDFVILDSGEDSEDKGQAEGQEGVQLEGHAPVVSQEHYHEGPYDKAGNSNLCY